MNAISNITPVIPAESAPSVDEQIALAAINRMAPAARLEFLGQAFQEAFAAWKEGHDPRGLGAPWVATIRTDDEGVSLSRVRAAA